MIKDVKRKGKDRRKVCPVKIMTERNMKYIEGTAINFGKKNYTVRSWVYAAVSVFLLVAGFHVYKENLWLCAVGGFLAAVAAVSAGQKETKESSLTAEKTGMVLGLFAVLEFMTGWAL